MIRCRVSSALCAQSLLVLAGRHHVIVSGQRPRPDGDTRIFTAVSFRWSSVSNPSSMRFSSAIFPVMKGLRSTFPDCTSLITSGWLPMYAMVPRKSTSLSTNFCSSSLAGRPQMATTTMTPPGLMASNRVSSTTCTELHSKATSAPDPPLSRLTSSTTSTSAGLRPWSATPVSKAFLPADFTGLAHDHSEPVGLEDGCGQQADGAGAADQRNIAGLRVATDEGVIAHGQRFDQRGLVKGDVTDRVHPAPLDRDLLAEAASPAGQPDEAHPRRDVVIRSRLRRFLRIDDVRLDNNIVADLEIGDVLADRVDRSGHLMPQRDRGRFSRSRVRMPGRRHEDRPFQILVQIRATDAAPGDVDTHRPGVQYRFVDILDADVATIEIGPLCRSRGWVS